MEDDFDFMPAQAVNKLFVRENHDGSRVYEYYFVGNIGEPSEYLDLCCALRSASPADLFVLRFNSGGGQVDSGNQILNCMRECEGTILGYIEHNCGSMCTFLFLACDDHYVSPYAEWFSHTVQSGHIGSEHETFEASQFLRKQTHKRIRTEYAGFYSDDEIESLLNNCHSYLDSDEIIERLAKFTELRQATLEDSDDYEDVSLEGIVKKAVKEALAELTHVSPVVNNVINMSEDEFEFQQAKDIVQVLTDGQVENGLSADVDGKSPETALPYPVDTTLENGSLQAGVWYKWEATEDSDCPLDSSALGDVQFGDGSVWTYQYLQGFNWDTNTADTDDVVKAFRIIK